MVDPNGICRHMNITMQSSSDRHFTVYRSTGTCSKNRWLGSVYVYVVFLLHTDKAMTSTSIPYIYSSNLFNTSSSSSSTSRNKKYCVAKNIMVFRSKISINEQRSRTRRNSDHRSLLIFGVGTGSSLLPFGLLRSLRLVVMLGRLVTRNVAVVFVALVSVGIVSMCCAT